MKKFNYENKQYLDKLNELNPDYYSKYINFIENFLKNKKSRFLDVGCGNGQVLGELKGRGFSNGYGIDISKLFIKEAKKKGLNVLSYNGKKFPFKDSHFNLIGSFNVLEHTENPEAFLNEQLLKLKKDGVLIVACPNFLSFLIPNSHRKLKGVKNKLRNLKTIFGKILSKDSSFERMKPVIRKKFEYDDDAIVVTNLLDLKGFFKKNNCDILYESGFINYDSFVFKMINLIPIIKYGLPSCFIVVKKK